VALVSSHGGHLTELEAVARSLRDVNTVLITYESARTAALHEAYRLRNIGANPFRLVAAFFQIAIILAKERPRAIISTGAEIAIPAFVLGKLLGIRLVFVESLCRVSAPSGTGFLLYPLSDLFLVQWPQLIQCYRGRAEHVGAIV
jgi:UDP-N-acetylglucosamine:LPS N-acetylglucosamine transferase